jgi:hypothetical protein
MAASLHQRKNLSGKISSFNKKMMSNKFWKMMDRFFLVLIEITGEKDAVHPPTASRFTPQQK